MTQSNFCNDIARCLIAISKKGGIVFNKYFLANACFLVMIVSVIAAFMDKITWGDVGLIFVGTLVVSIINGIILGRRIRNREM